MKPLQISLAAARVNADLTQEDVANALGISKNTVVNWEKGRTVPDMAQWRKLELLYNIPMDYIFLPNELN